MKSINRLVKLDGSKEEIVSNLQKKYSGMVEKEDGSWEIQQLSRQTGVIPELSDAELKRLYLSSARGYVSPFQLKAIKKWDSKVHNGKPAVFNNLGDDFAEALQEGYSTLIEDGRHDEEDFKELEKLTGISVTQETVNKAFNQRFKKRVVLNKEMDWIERDIGIRPKLDEKIVQDLYRKCLRDEKIKSGQHLYFWGYIAKSSEIMPEEKTAQSAFRHLVKNNDVFDLIRFSEFTGITPEEKIVKDAYHVLAKKGEEFSSKYNEMKKISGRVEPNENVIQLAYRNILEKGNLAWDYSFKNVKELTRINPRDDLVQKAYAKCIEEGDFGDYQELCDTFVVEPSNKVKKALENYLSS